MPVWCPIGSSLCQHAGGHSVTTEACTSPHLPGFVWCGGLKAHWGYLRYDGSWQYCEKGPYVMISLYMKDDHYKSSIDEHMQDIRPNYVLEYKVFRGNFRKISYVSVHSNSLQYIDCGTAAILVKGGMS